MTRNRYSNGHCMKSPAREGESEAGAMATGTGAGTAAAAGSTVASPWSATVAAGRAGPPASSATSSMLVSMPTDLTARH